MRKITHSICSSLMPPFSKPNRLAQKFCSAPEKQNQNKKLKLTIENESFAVIMCKDTFTKDLQKIFLRHLCFVVGSKSYCYCTYQVNLREPPTQQHNCCVVTKILSIDIFGLSSASLWESVFGFRLRLSVISNPSIK